MHSLENVCDVLWYCLILQRSCIHANATLIRMLVCLYCAIQIYRILPVRKPLLEGLLSADLVGFHTYDYARHFLSACSRVLEVMHMSIQISAYPFESIKFAAMFSSKGFVESSHCINTCLSMPL
jgi:Glycosyltransferase family 20